MRFVFLIPDLEKSPVWKAVDEAVRRRPLRPVRKPLQKVLGHPLLRTDVVWGGTLNIMRHCWVARTLGLEAVLATQSGRDSYGEAWGIKNLPFIGWSDRRPDDVCIVPDFVTELIDDVAGPVIAYLQVPIHLYDDFDYKNPRVVLWTDSPFMLDKCQAKFPGKHIEIVPNVVDNEAFPFRPQSERTPGSIFAFPRKGPEYIAETEARYAELGGTYWKVERIDGIPLHELAKRFAEPQAFLASAEVEGCALPPQESMAAGVVVVGKNARGANFSMDHRKTAMIADTPAEAAQCLRDLEDDALRAGIAERAHAFISRYFPDGEPATLWRDTARRFGAVVEDA